MVADALSLSDATFGLRQTGQIFKTLPLISLYALESGDCYNCDYYIFHHLLCDISVNQHCVNKFRCLLFDSFHGPPHADIRAGTGRNPNKQYLWCGPHKEMTH